MIVHRGSIVTTEEILDTHFSSFSASGRRCTAMAGILPEWKNKKRENGFGGSTEASMRGACAPLVIAHNPRESYRSVALRPLKQNYRDIERFIELDSVRR